MYRGVASGGANNNAEDGHSILFVRLEYRLLAGEAAILSGGDAFIRVLAGTFPPEVRADMRYNLTCGGGANMKHHPHSKSPAEKGAICLPRMVNRSLTIPTFDCFSATGPAVDWKLRLPAKPQELQKADPTTEVNSNTGSTKGGVLRRLGNSFVVAGAGVMSSAAYTIRDNGGQRSLICLAGIGALHMAEFSEKPSANASIGRSRNIAMDTSSNAAERLGKCGKWRRIWGVPPYRYLVQHHERAMGAVEGYYTYRHQLSIWRLSLLRPCLWVCLQEKHPPRASTKWK